MPPNFVAAGPEAYDAQMGRWSRRLAVPFLDFAGSPEGERVLDVGCGTGNLALALLARGARCVDAIDFDAGFVEAVRARSQDARLQAQVGDACALPYADGTFDRALSMLVFHFVSDAGRAIAEMRRVLRPGGVAAATVWDTYGGMPAVRMFQDTAAAIAPEAHARRESQTMRPMTREGELKAAFEAEGFRDVSDTMLTIRMDFESFDDFWIPTTQLHGATSAFMASLAQATRGSIEAAVRAAYLCGRPDGPRGFVSAAWAVRGMAP